MTIPITTMTLKPNQQPSFLEKLGGATTKKGCGLYLFEEFLSPEEAEDAFDILINDEKFPWYTEPEEQKTNEQDLFQFAREQKQKRGTIKDTNDFKGLLKLGQISAKIEKIFGVRISFVFCNKFQNRDQRLDCHKNAYAQHICVLTLGSKRRVEFRNRKTRKIEAITPGGGDLYIMPLKLDDTHAHRVCPTNEANPNGTNDFARMSFVFFFEAPKKGNTVEVEERQDRPHKGQSIMKRKC